MNVKVASFEIWVHIIPGGKYFLYFVTFLTIHNSYFDILVETDFQSDDNMMRYMMTMARMGTA